MKVDPVTIFWISLITTILQGLTSGTVHLTGLVPDAYIPMVTGWMGLIVFVNMSFLTALNAFSSNKSGPLAPPPTVAEATTIMAQAKKASVLFLVVVLGTLLTMPSAHARSSLGRLLTSDRVSVRLAETARPLPPPVAPGTVPLPTPAPKKGGSVLETVRGGGKVRAAEATADPIGLLQGIIASQVLADVTVAKADADAQVPPDKIASMCWGAIIDFVNSNPSLNPLPQGLGAAQLIQKARDLEALVANLNSPTGPLSPLKIGCGPLVLDTNTQLIAIAGQGAGFLAVIGSMLGVVIP